MVAVQVGDDSHPQPLGDGFRRDRVSIALSRPAFRRYGVLISVPAFGYLRGKLPHARVFAAPVERLVAHRSKRERGGRVRFGARGHGKVEGRADGGLGGFRRLRFRLGCHHCLGRSVRYRAFRLFRGRGNSSTGAEGGCAACGRSSTVTIESRPASAIA